MAWYLHAVEIDERGIWSCRRGRTEIDRHSSLGEALVHLHEIAAEISDTEVEIFMHPLSGDIVRHVLPLRARPSVRPSVESTGVG